MERSGKSALTERRDPQLSHSEPLKRRGRPRVVTSAEDPLQVSHKPNIRKRLK